MTKKNKSILIELTVNNHPGVMSHICGLFSRRAYNLERILCIPQLYASKSTMWLQVDEENKLEQIAKQLEKLEDVKKLICHRNSDNFFHQLEAAISEI
jgi:acetolactate synthase-1/3 small subunit